MQPADAMNRVRDVLGNIPGGEEGITLIARNTAMDEDYDITGVVRDGDNVVLLLKDRIVLDNEKAELPEESAEEDLDQEP